MCSVGVSHVELNASFSGPHLPFFVLLRVILYLSSNTDFDELALTSCQVSGP